MVYSSRSGDEKLPSVATSSQRVARDQVIDVIRGLCILSMVLSHTARDSPLDTYLHLAWVDGASGFFLMSGLVLGIVQRRTVDARGVATGQRRTIRRIGVLYATQMMLVAAAIVVAPLRVNDFRIWPDVRAYSGWPDFLWHAATLQVNPKDLDVLPAYIAIFVLLLIALPALTRYGAKPVLLGSLALYVASTPFEQLTTPWRGDASAKLAQFNWGCWQLLFISAFVVGWYWQDKNIGALLLRKRIVMMAGVALVVIYAVATGVSHLGRPGEFLIDNLFEYKRNNPPGRVVLAWLAFIVLYGAFTWLARRGRLALLRRESATLGRWSLNAYVILCLSVSVSALIPGYAGPNWRAMTLAVAVCLTALSWAHLRDGRAAAARKRHESARASDSLEARVPTPDPLP